MEAMRETRLYTRRQKGTDEWKRIKADEINVLVVNRLLIEALEILCFLVT